MIGIPLLQEWWRWHCYSHPDYLSLHIHHVTFYLSTLEAHISNTRHDRNKWISDAESRRLEDYILLSGSSTCTCNTHAQGDAWKHCFIYPRTTNSPLSNLLNHQVAVDVKGGFLSHFPYILIIFKWQIHEDDLNKLNCRW